jgi:hypothetical protein
MNNKEAIEEKLDESGWQLVKRFVQDDGPPDTIIGFGNGLGEQRAYGLLICVPIPFGKEYVGIHAQGPTPADGRRFDAELQRILNELGLAK